MCLYDAHQDDNGMRVQGMISLPCLIFATLRHWIL